MSKHQPPEAGKSSYGLCDLELLWTSLPLGGTNSVLDAGCGRGLYTLAIASRLEAHTRIVGVDLWKEGIQELSRMAREQGMGNVEAVCADLSDLGFLDGESIDLVFGATILHDLVARGRQAPVLAELSRVLRSGGLMALIEFHKRASHPGPPEGIRIGPNLLREIVSPFALEEEGVYPLGEHVYQSIFRIR